MKEDNGLLPPVGLATRGLTRCAATRAALEPVSPLCNRKFKIMSPKTTDSPNTRDGPPCAQRSFMKYKVSGILRVRVLYCDRRISRNAAALSAHWIHVLQKDWPYRGTQSNTDVTAFPLDLLLVYGWFILARQAIPLFPFVLSIRG